jgi:hypothetical protein
MSLLLSATAAASVTGTAAIQEKIITVGSGASFSSHGFVTGGIDPIGSINNNSFAWSGGANTITALYSIVFAPGDENFFYFVMANDTDLPTAQQISVQVPNFSATYFSAQYLDNQCKFNFGSNIHAWLAARVGQAVTVRLKMP